LAGIGLFFYSNEGNPREPIHIHVKRGEADAKFWLHPDVIVADGYAFDASVERAWREQLSDGSAL